MGRKVIGKRETTIPALKSGEQTHSQAIRGGRRKGALLMEIFLWGFHRICV